MREQLEALRHQPAPEQIEAPRHQPTPERPVEVVEPPAEHADRPEPEPAPATRVFTLQGLVRRADGQHVFWLNQVNNLDGVTTVTGAEVRVHRAGPTGVPIYLPQSAGIVVLRAGQSYDMAGGRIYDAFETITEVMPNEHHETFTNE